MFIMPKHGSTALASSTSNYSRSDYYPAVAACGFTNSNAYQANISFGDFAYYFKNGDGLDASEQLVNKLDALADAMVRQQPEESENSQIAPIMTYFGQFIDHDITANTDRKTGISVIDTEDVVPAERDIVEDQLKNLRAGALNLDSVHGGGPSVGDFAQKLTKALRFHGDPAKLWAGTTHRVPDQVITPPDDIARDVLRLRDLLRRGIVTEAELHALPADLKEAFFFKDGSLRVQRAILGDMRNDENLAVSQFHLVWIRLHNEIVDRAYENRDEHPDAPRDDKDKLFEWARKRTSWIYQWLVLHHYLPAIGDPETIADITQHGPRLYTKFFNDHPPAGNGLLTLPLEFSVAAFRFGHSMVRDAYDWNRFFGRPVGQPNLDQANFRLLFSFTGGGDNPMPLPEGGNAEHLPSNWPIDWERFVGPVPEDMPDRSARKIDTRLSPVLGKMQNEPDGMHGVFKQLARRNLRRGLRLNIPTAQGLQAAMANDYGITIALLSADEIASGETEAEVRAGGFETRTPLWFYVLKEAELHSGGQCLGPMGTRLVADTIHGLVACDPDSYLNAAPGGANWMPEDSVKPNGVSIHDLPSLMKAAGVMD